jgi:hypothetical protein
MEAGHHGASAEGRAHLVVEPAGIAHDRCHMELQDIFLARYADVAPDGLFTAVGGGINRINVSGFPWSLGFLFMLARYRLSSEEVARQHVMAVDRVTPNGQTEPLGAEFPMIQLAPHTQPGPDGKFVFSLSYLLANLVFPEDGVYKYRLKIDGQKIGEAHLLVAGPTQGGQS